MYTGYPLSMRALDAAIAQGLPTPSVGALMKMADAENRYNAARARLKAIQESAPVLMLWGARPSVEAG